MMKAEDDGGLLEATREIAHELTADLQPLQAHAPCWSDPEEHYPQVAAALDRCRDRLAAIGLVGEANRLPSSELWRIAGQILELGWLQNRARTKPRGYAGDFEMLARICDGWRCEDPLGRLFDRYFQSEAAPQAVRNRTQLMAELIAAQCRASAGAFRVVSVGSGPGEDLRRAADMLPAEARSQLQVTLLDIDPDALDFATQRLSTVLQPDQISARRENLFRLSKNRQLQAELAGAQLVYCTGLFDYLNVPEGGDLLRTMWSWLAPGGQTLAFNFTLPNPTRTYMEWIGNWYLTYRTREELAELAHVAGIPASAVTLGAEATGVNLYLQAQRS
jgi:extracellular factor (EF) 3-hydroxypalmitic acid methyl ester biosynthesis protein